MPVLACSRHSARRLWSSAAPDRGWALNRLWSSLYGAKYCNDCAGLNVAKAPARGAVGRCAAARKRASIPRIGTKPGTTAQGQKTNPTEPTDRPPPGLVQQPRLVDQHHRDATPDRKGETGGFAHQFLPLRIIVE